MEKLEQVKKFLNKKRNLIKATFEAQMIDEDGYFDAQSISGGNFDDCYYLGKEVGEAELIEDILSLIEQEGNDENIA